LRDVLPSETALEEPCRETSVARGILEALWGPRDPVVVRSDADVVDPRDLDRVQRVVDDAVERKRSRVLLEAAALQERPLGLVLAAESAVGRGLAQTRVLRLRLLRQERDAERDPDDAAGAAELAQLIVRQVPRVIVQRLASRVARENRYAARLDRV